MILTFDLLPLIIGISCFVILLLVVLGIFLVKRKKSPKIKVNEGFIETLLNALGGKENIVDAKTINGRLHVDVSDLDLLHQEELKGLSTAGVFITNQTVKMLFSYDSQTICKALLASKGK